MSNANDYAPLFEPGVIGSLTLPNRVVFPPMTRCFCGPVGVPGPDIARYYANFAKGGTGLIIAEACAVNNGTAVAYRGAPGLCNDAQEAGWRAVVDAVHAAGGRIILQLWHGGRLSHQLSTGGLQPIAPSAVRATGGPYIDWGVPETFDGHLSYPEPRAMTLAEIEATVEEFAQATRRAQRAGFDGVLFHSGSGYLIHQFTNPESNQRQDAYGGDLVKRARFGCEILQASRAVTSADFPLLMTVMQFTANNYEWVTWDTPQELGTTMECFKKAGADGFHVYNWRIPKPAFLAAADPAGHGLAWHVRKLTGMPVIAAGGITYSNTVRDSLAIDTTSKSQVTDPIDAVQYIVNGDTDFIAPGRAMIANPDWANKVRDGRWHELRPFDRELLATLRLDI